MMFKDEMLLIEDENGTEKEYAILATFDIEVKNKSYVLYTDYSKDEDNNMQIFVSSYDKDGNLSSLSDADEIEYINNFLKDLEDDIKSGINFI